MKDVPSTSSETLARARGIALKNGIHYAYTGNIHDEEGQSTYCHSCKAKLIGRDWYRLSTWGLTADGHCKACGIRCAGFFRGPPGEWGSKRLPVQLSAL